VKPNILFSSFSQCKTAHSYFTLSTYNMSQCAIRRSSLIDI